MATPRVIGILLGLQIDYGRGVLTGFSRYALQAGWQLIYQSVDEFEKADLKRWRERKVDGYIVHMHDQNTAGLAHLGVPAVNVSSTLESQIDAPTVASDDRYIGRLAAEHLMRQELWHFAYFGEKGRHYSEARLAGYVAALREKGFDCATLVSGQPREMTDWIDALPKPVGLLASNDHRAAELLNACLSAGVDVRGSVAMVGVDNAWATCEATFPRLTSVAVPFERIGWEAAALLDRMMIAAARGEPLERPADILVAPESIVVRESSIQKSVDAEIGEALKVIRNQIRTLHSVDELADRLAINRRTLERRFAQVLGRSPLEEIHRVRLSHARQLLSETNLPITRIATQCGFGSASRMGLVFRQHLQQTPTAYRLSHRGRTLGS